MQDMRHWHICKSAAELGGTTGQAVADRQDTIIENKKDKIWLLTDVAIQSDRNVIQKENNKKL
jgi:hypothetical protein